VTDRRQILRFQPLIDLTLPSYTIET
jgi:hypothetical protein